MRYQQYGAIVLIQCIFQYGYAFNFVNKHNKGKEDKDKFKEYQREYREKNKDKIYFQHKESSKEFISKH